MPELYAFNNLKNYLKSKGYTVRQGKGFRPLKIEDVNFDDISNGNLEISTDGVYVIEPDGNKRQAFLYKRKYRLDLSKPVYHPCRCSVIQNYMDNGSFEVEYRRANTSKVKVIDKLSNVEKDVDQLPLCKNCARIILMYMKQIGPNSTSSDFAKVLMDAEERTLNNEYSDVEVNLFGYTKDWNKVSAAYRQKKDYTCENCGLKITDPMDYWYMHVHHLNGKKYDNRESNFKCLCVKCHSEVDEKHLKNFQKRRMTMDLNSFMVRYHSEEILKITVKCIFRIRNTEVERKVEGRVAPNIWERLLAMKGNQQQLSLLKGLFNIRINGLKKFEIVSVIKES